MKKSLMTSSKPLEMQAFLNGVFGGPWECVETSKWENYHFKMGFLSMSSIDLCEFRLETTFNLFGKP